VEQFETENLRFFEKFHFSENFVPQIPEKLVSATIINPQCRPKFGAEVSKCVLHMRRKRAYKQQLQTKKNPINEKKN
jgi:hypothetical protein